MYKTIITNQVDDKLIGEWKQLWKRAENASIFNSYEWFLISIELNKDKTYELHLCYENKKLVAVLPLQKYKCFGVSVWGSINKEHLVDTSFLIEKYDKVLFIHFFKGIIKEKSIFLQKTDSNASHLLKNIFPNMFFSLISVNPTVAINDQPFVQISSSTNAQIKKIIRKNSDQLRFVMYHDNLQKHMKTMLSLQKKSSKNIRSMDIFENLAHKSYYQTVTKKCSDMVRICFLYLNDVPIAYQYGFVYRNIFLGDQIAYRNEYSKLRPGKTILYFLLEELQKQHIGLFDLGGGISAYKMEFTHDYRTLYNLYYSKNSYVMFWWKLINKVRRIKQQLFSKKFTRDKEFLFRSITDHVINEKH